MAATLTAVAGRAARWLVHQPTARKAGYALTARSESALLTALAGIFWPAVTTVEVDGPARLPLTAVDAGLIRRLLGGTRRAGQPTGDSAIFLDAIHVKTRTGFAANRSVYAAVGAVEGRLEILGMWAEPGGRPSACSSDAVPGRRGQ